MASYLFRLTGQAFNLTGRLAPGLAGRTAFRLFSTTPGRRPKTEKERRLLAQAQVRMRDASCQMLDLPGGGAVASHVFSPTVAESGQRVLVVHGWGSRIDYLQALISGLRATGAQVVGLDLPGHGRSTGRTLTVPLALAAIGEAWRAHGPFDAIVGHSFGGFTSAMAVAGGLGVTEGVRPEKLVLIAAPVAATDVFAGFSGQLGFSNRVRGAMDRHVQKIAGQPVDYFDAARLLATAPALPVLVLHAEDDKEVAADAALRYGAAGENVTVKWMNGHGHRRIVSSPEVIDAITGFLASMS